MAIMDGSDVSIKTLHLLLECLKRYHNLLLEDKEFHRKANLTKVKALRCHLAKIYTIDDECSREAIKKALGWTTWTLRNTAYMGLNGTITSYIHKLRVQRAAELLRGTEHKIYEISNIVGFFSTRALIRNFKKLKGLTPAEYRKHHALKNKSFSNNEKK